MTIGMSAHLAGPELDVGDADVHVHAFPCLRVLACALEKCGSPVVFNGRLRHGSFGGRDRCCIVLCCDGARLLPCSLLLRCLCSLALRFGVRRHDAGKLVYHTILHSQALSHWRSAPVCRNLRLGAVSFSRRFARKHLPCSSLSRTLTQRARNTGVYK